MKTKIKSTIDQNSGFIIIVTSVAVLGIVVAYNVIKHGIATI